MFNISLIGWLLVAISEILIGGYVMFWVSNPTNWCALLGAFIMSFGVMHVNAQTGYDCFKEWER